MSTLLRPSTRQVARIALRSTSRTSALGARIPRIAPATSSSSTYLLPRPRFYSTNPTPPEKPEDKKQPQKEESNKKEADAPKDNGEVKASSQEGSASAPQAKPDGEGKERPELPEGWVWLEKEDLEEFEKLASNIPSSQAGVTKGVRNYIQKHGAPKEMQTLLRKKAAVGLSIVDSMKVMSIAWKLADRIASDEQVPNDMFSSNEPRPGGDKAGEQHQQTQKKQENESEEEKAKRRERQTKHNRNDPNIKVIDGNDILGWILLGLVGYPLYLLLFPSDSREISWQELRRNYLDKGLVEKLVVVGGRVRVELNQEAAQSIYPEQPVGTLYVSIGSSDAFERHLDEAQEELGIPSNERIPVTYQGESGLANLFLAFGPTLLVVGLLYSMSRRGPGGGAGGGMFGFSKSKAKMYNHESAVKVKFTDVAGMDEAKTEIMEFVSFLKDPTRFQRLGAKIPRGAVLSGPPGTGKTLLAKATAGESGVPFFSVSGSEFVEMFVGVGASRVRDLFAQARKNAPCIIFIDEIDAIGRSRSDSNRGFGGNDEREATLNQILTEMDGFNTQEQIVVLAGTNRPDVLDKALMRPGRFDRQIYIDRPTMQGRADIFKVYLSKIVTKEDIEYLRGRLAALTPGFAGADIANAVNEAALVAARANAETVEMKHFEQAIERVIGGLERKSLVLNPTEKRTVAYHEAGHAICGWYFEHADPLLKVSIIPRGKGALGYAQYLPVGDAYLMTTAQLMDRMAMTLGGRISEELHFPTVTTGASDDFKKVTQVATHMVTQWGMSDKLGPIHFEQDKNQFSKPFAEETAQKIDAEVRRIVDQAYKQCKDLLVAKQKEVGIVAEELLRLEMLTRDDMVRLLGPRPFADKEEFTKYFDNSRSAPPPPPTEDSGPAGVGDDTPPPPAPAPAFQRWR